MFAVFAKATAVDCNNDIQDAASELSTTTAEITSTPDPCNCVDTCLQSRIIGLTSSSTTDDNDVEIQEKKSKIISDEAICARNHEGDRTFSSICHMMCHNKCTRYGIERMILDENNEVNVVIAHRESEFNFTSFFTR